MTDKEVKIAFSKTNWDVEIHTNNVSARRQPPVPMASGYFFKFFFFLFVIFFFFTFSSFSSPVLTKQHRLLSSERTALSQLGLTTGRSAQNGRAAITCYGGLSVGKNGGNVETTRALHVHEKGSWRLHQGLQLVLLGLRGRVRVQQILN